jgi:hypothetical protein
VTDEPKPLTEEELGRLERWVRGVVEKRHDSNAIVEWGAEDLLRLVTDYRRLRQLVVDAEPYVPDNEQARTIDLVARLKAEIDRA